MTKGVNLIFFKTPSSPCYGGFPAFVDSNLKILNWTQNKKILQVNNLKKQPTFRDATTGPPYEMTSEKRGQKFQSDDASLSRSG